VRFCLQARRVCPNITDLSKLKADQLNAMQMEAFTACPDCVI
jgi:hypothetical protein